MSVSSDNYYFLHTVCMRSNRTEFNSTENVTLLPLAILDTSSSRFTELLIAIYNCCIGVNV